MDDAAADVPKRLFIPRFPLLPLDGYVASSVHSSLRELVYRRNCGIYVISYLRIYISFLFSILFSERTRIDFCSNGTNRLEIQINRIAHDIAKLSDTGCTETGFDELCSSNGFTSSSTITSVLPGSPISC